MRNLAGVLLGILALNLCAGVAHAQDCDSSDDQKVEGVCAGAQALAGLQACSEVIESKNSDTQEWLASNLEIEKVSVTVKSAIRDIICRIDPDDVKKIVAAGGTKLGKTGNATKAFDETQLGVLQEKHECGIMRDGKLVPNVYDNPKTFPTARFLALLGHLTCSSDTTLESNCDAVIKRPRSALAAKRNLKSGNKKSGERSADTRFLEDKKDRLLLTTCLEKALFVVSHHAWQECAANTSDMGKAAVFQHELKKRIYSRKNLYRDPANACEADDKALDWVSHISSQYQQCGASRSQGYLQNLRRMVTSCGGQPIFPAKPATGAR